MKDFIYTLQRYMQENAKTRVDQSPHRALNGNGPLEADMSVLMPRFYVVVLLKPLQGK
jgi:hypothetical protein